MREQLPKQAIDSVVYLTTLVRLQVEQEGGI